MRLVVTSARRLIAATTLSLVVAIGSSAAAAEWTVVPDSSAVTMYATKQGAWVAGNFEEFSASIEFDSADPQAGKIVGVVATGSVVTGDAQNDAYVLGYLNVEEYPQSRFESSVIEKTADGYRALGDLSLAGHTKSVALDFTFATGTEPPAAAELARFTGTMTINRFDFDIASDIDVNSAGQDVIVQIELDLKP
jgi:polyisoprenoid-binding protein YceI